VPVGLLKEPVTPAPIPMDPAPPYAAETPVE
jgi:hypothetical protein